MREQIKERARAKRLLDNYKLTIEQYDAIFAYQNGVCYACGQPEPVKGRRLSVDHCHKTGLVRGLLCSRCNPLLGKIENAYKRYGLGKVSGLTVAILLEFLTNYVKFPPAVKALGMEHFGYTGRTGTKTHRALLRRQAKNRVPPSIPLLRGSR